MGSDVSLSLYNTRNCIAVAYLTRKNGNKCHEIDVPKVNPKPKCPAQTYFTRTLDRYKKMLESITSLIYHCSKYKSEKINLKFIISIIVELQKQYKIWKNISFYVCIVINWAHLVSSVRLCGCVTGRLHDRGVIC